MTTTNESEYSPTVTPDGRSFSVIQVEADGTQRLWRFPLAGGGEPKLVLPDIKPVGYHAWADAANAGVVRPRCAGNRELRVNARTGKSEIIASRVGRSHPRIPGGGISFVQTETIDGTPRATVKGLDPATKRSRMLVRVIEGATATRSRLDA